MTKHKSSFASPLLIAAVSLASVLVSGGEARADEPAACDTDSYLCVTADNIVVGKSLAELPLKNGLNSGWLPQCDGGNPNDSCSQFPSGNCGPIGACIEAAMNDSKVDISMTGNWDVAWPEVGKLQVHPRAKVNGGKYAIKYKLSPTFGIMINTFGLQTNFALDPFELLKAMGTPDEIKEFNYEASGSCPFTPWAFGTPTSCNVQGDPSDIVAIPLGNLINNMNNYVEISISLAAGTNTTFTWRTDELSLTGGDGPITGSNATASIPYYGGSPAQVVVGGKGTLGYSGKTSLMPVITVYSVAGFKLGNGVKLPININAGVDFSGSIPVDLKKTSFDVDLPDLFVPTTTLDFGTIEVGQKGTKKLKLQNSGDLTALAELESDKPTTFKALPKNATIEAKSTGEVELTFTPMEAGSFAGTFTVKSNDPDEPVVTFNVKGKGKITGEELPEEEEPGEGGSSGSSSGGKAGSAGKKSSTDNPASSGQDSSSDGGCGCHVAGGESSNSPKMAGLGLLAGVVVLGRRRRKSLARSRNACRSHAPCAEPGARAGGVVLLCAASTHGFTRSLVCLSPDRRSGCAARRAALRARAPYAADPALRLAWRGPLW